MGFEVGGLEDLEAPLLTDEATEARSKLIDAGCANGHLKVKYEAATVFCGGYGIRIGICGRKLLSLLRQNSDGEVHLSGPRVESLVTDMEVARIRIR